MPAIVVTRKQFLEDAQGRTFTDVVNDPKQPFDDVLTFFSDENRQSRMEDSEIHHDRAPLAGVVRELESQPGIDLLLSGIHVERSKRLRQAIGVLVRIIMEERGWKKAGRKGSLGVRAPAQPQQPVHNEGGLAFWFIRAERYQRPEGMPFQSVDERCRKLDSTRSRKSAAQA